MPEAKIANRQPDEELIRKAEAEYDNAWQRGDIEGSKHTSRITRISFVTDNVAVADGEAFIEGVENLSATDTHHRFTDILVRRGEAWLIAHIRACGRN